MGIFDFRIKQGELDIASLWVYFTDNGRNVSGYGFRQHSYFFLVVKLGLDGPSLDIPAAVVGDSGADHQGGVGVAVVEIGSNEEITYMNLWSSEEVHVSVDTAEPPHVLVFKIAAVRPSIGFDGECIFTCFEGLGDIEFGGSHAVLAVTDLSAVHPDVEGAFDAVEMEENLAVLPPVGNGELSSI